MKYTTLNKNWNVALTVSEPEILASGNDRVLVFDLAPDLAHIDEGDKGELEFSEVYAYKLWEITRENYEKGDFRFTNLQLPWGALYELTDSNWKNDFPADKIVVNESLKEGKLKHYLLFLPGGIFECLAMEYMFQFHYVVADKLEERYPKGYLNHYLAMFSAHFNQLNADNYKIYTNLYIQLEGKKEFEGLKEEIRKIKTNKDIDSYVKIANQGEIPGFGRKQLEEMIKVIETYDSKSKYA